MLAYDAPVKETFNYGATRSERVRTLADIQSELIRDLNNLTGETAKGQEREVRRVVNGLYRGETVEFGWTTYTPA